jgi:hypothetical protein
MATTASRRGHDGIDGPFQRVNAFAKNEVVKWTDLVKISGARAE